MQQHVTGVVGQDNGPFGTVGTPTIIASEARPGEVMLIDPLYSGFSFGPHENGTLQNIQFGPKGGFQDHVWIGSAEHDLLDALLAARPDITIAEPGPQRIIVCPMDQMEFKTQFAFNRHAATKHRPQTIMEQPPTGPTAPPELSLPGVEAVDLGDDDVTLDDALSANAADEGRG